MTEEQIRNAVRAEIEPFRKDVNERLGAFGERLDTVGEQIDTINERLGAFGERLDTVGEQIDTINERLDTVGERLTVASDDRTEMLRILKVLEGRRTGRGSPPPTEMAAKG